VVTLLKRELTSLSLWAGTYAVAFGFIIISGVFFINLVSTNNSADLASYFANIVNLFGLICPVLAARSLAEERASGALMVTLAWPVPRWALILSKFIANTLFTWLLVSISWIYYAQLNAYAEPDRARAFGGWFGMLLVVMLFNAISLAVCSRTATAASGAFLSFVVLLFFLVVRFLPEGFRNHLDQFGPFDHLDPMLRGIIYYSDVLYFIVLSTAGLGMAVYAISRRRAGTDRQVIARRVAAVAAVVFVFVGTPGIADAASGQVDLTPQKRETVSEATKEVIKKVGNVPIRLTAFTADVSQGAAEIRSTVRKYKAAGANIDYKIIDPDISPALAAASGITDYDTYLLQVGDKKQEIDDLVESTVTSAISLLGKQNPPVACFVQGHGERKLQDPGNEGLTSFAARLRIAGYMPAQLFLEGKGAQDLLHECKVVVEMGPRTIMRPEEIQLLQDYARQKGRLVLAADSVRGNIPQLNQLISPWGIQLTANPIRDPQSLADDPAAIVSSRYPTASPIVDVLDHDDTPVIFANTLAVGESPAANAEGAPQITHLVSSSPKSYQVDAEGKKVKNSEAEYTLAALTNATELTGNGTDAVLASTRIGVVGSGSVASNEYQKSFGDQEFMIRLLQYVAQDDQIVSAYREVGANSQFNITGPQRRTLIKKCVVFPGLAALVFIPFVLWRLKRG
jgi:ABC-type transport system involved in multi-copper enzyme maturation permease subunit/ABC-type uncharacterized transport system involved in gliding motility auxiliary subunit